MSYGDHAARAHYEAPAQGSAPLVPGALLLLDLWAKEPGGIYADQTWMASFGPPSDRAAGLWRVVRGARDAALELVGFERFDEVVDGAVAHRGDAM